MRRLPADRMLSAAIARRRVDPGPVTQAAHLLATFYLDAEPVEPAPEE